MDRGTWKILIVDDDEDDYVIIRQMLSDARGGKYRHDWAHSYEEGWRKIQEGMYDVILVDYDLGPRNGLEMIRDLVKTGCHVPTILFTGRGSYEIDLEAMEAGATLYLTKHETSALMLERSIRYAIGHKRIEEELTESEARFRASEKRYRDLIRYAPAGIYEIDFRTQRFVSVNDAMCKLSGYSREELLAMDPFDLLEDASKVVFRERINQWMNGEEPEKNVLYKVRVKSGALLDVVLNTTFNKDAEGNPASATVIGFDITESRQVEERERNQYALLQTIVQSTPAAICLMQGSDLRIEFANPAFEVFSGCEQLVGKSLGTLCPDFDPNYVDKCLSVLATGEPYRVTDEPRVVRRLPQCPVETAYFSWALYRVEMPGTRGLGVICVAWETSQRKQAEEALRQSQAYISRLVDTSYEGIWSVDRNGNTTFVNQRAAEILGYTVDEIRERNALEFLMAEDMESGRETLARISRGESGRVEAHAHYKDGHEAWLLVSFSPILDDDGEIQGALAMFSDITARKKMEKSLQSYAEQLKRSNQELENFAFQASHDLQEPLRKIEGFGRELAKLAGDHLDDTGQDYLQRMTRAATRMRIMVNDLLTLSRVTSQGLHIEDIDLTQLVRSVVEDLDERLRQTQGTVTVEELEHVRADSTQIYLLMQNLIGNALKFHRPNVPPAVRISSRRLAGNQVEIRVQDNGIGFDDQQAQRLFQPFQRLQNRYAYEGNGIGLSICRKVVERYGGSISASGTPGEGSVFIVILPVDAPQEI